MFLQFLELISENNYKSNNYLVKQILATALVKFEDDTWTLPMYTQFLTTLVSNGFLRANQLMNELRKINMDAALKKLLDGKWSHVTYLKLKGLLVSHRIILR